MKIGLTHSFWYRKTSTCLEVNARALSLKELSSRTPLKLIHPERKSRQIGAFMSNPASGLRLCRPILSLSNLDFDIHSPVS